MINLKRSLLALTVGTALVGCGSDDNKNDTDKAANLAVESRSIDSATSNDWYVAGKANIANNATTFANIICR